MRSKYLAEISSVGNLAVQPLTFVRNLPDRRIGVSELSTGSGTGTNGMLEKAIRLPRTPRGHEYFGMVVCLSNDKRRDTRAYYN